MTLGLLSGCSPKARQTCVPGQQASCACPGTTLTGVQDCSADGTAFGSCSGCPATVDAGPCDTAHGDAGATDGGSQTDAGGSSDAGTSDSGSADAGSTDGGGQPAPDSGMSDGGTSDAGTSDAGSGGCPPVAVLNCSMESNSHGAVAATGACLAPNTVCCYQANGASPYDQDSDGFLDCDSGCGATIDICTSGATPCDCDDANALIYPGNGCPAFPGECTLP